MPKEEKNSLKTKQKEKTNTRKTKQIIIIATNNYF